LTKADTDGIFLVSGQTTFTTILLCREKTMITLRNDFHGTLVRIVGIRPIRAATIDRIRDRLCGVSGCRCGGLIGERGKQSPEANEFIIDASDVILCQ
jgi:hypothetical protein